MPAQPIVLPINAGLMFNGNRVSDHNRSPISVTVERKENRKRMANGDLRVFVVSQKRVIKVSWKDLPHDDARSADGFWSVASLQSFYNGMTGSFTLRITYGDNSYEDISVMFKDFNLTLKKRSSYIIGLYDLDITLEEV